MLISDYLNTDCIRVGVQCDTKEEVLKELVELQFKIHPEVDRKELKLSAVRNVQFLQPLFEFSANPGGLPSRIFTGT